MELLAQGAMVERFERKKVDVKHRLNDLVDDLFAFMLSEVTALVPPLPTIMATAGGATITRLAPQQPCGQPGPSTNGQLVNKAVAKTIPQPAAAVAAVPIAPVQAEMAYIKEEADESLDDFEVDQQGDELPPGHHQHGQSSSSEGQLSPQLGHHHFAAAFNQQGTQHHHPNGYCDSDSESCECYDCMDESLVKVEMDEEGPGVANETGHFHMEHHQHRRKKAKSKRQRSNEDGTAGTTSRSDAADSGQGDGEDVDGEEGENGANNHQIVTIGLKCWFADCQAMLDDRAKLNQHLFFEHEKTLPYHCRVVGCGRQFDVRKEFWQHIRSGHSDYTCSICSIKFNGYFPFITHEFQLHEEGIFKCSREDCDFMASLRDLVYKHTKTEHVKFVCTFEGCDATFECYSYLKRHRRIHSQVKPYRCKWPNCGYSSTQCGAVIQHIRIRHFKLPSSVKKQKELNIVDHRNPNDYLEVLTELLN